MMPVILIILIPLGALVIYAVAYDLRRRRRGDRTGHDITSAARLARTNADAHGVQGGISGGDPGGAGVGGGPGI